MIACNLVRVLPKVTVLLSALVLCACAENVSTVDMDSTGFSQLKMAAPAFLSSRAVVVENLDLDVTINNERVEMARNGDLWSGTMQVPENSNVNLKVEWFELFSSRRLLLARAEASETDLKSNISFALTSADYVIDGAEFDADGDLISNITERRQDTNPLDADSPGTTEEVEPMVKIPASLKDNDIDAQFNTAFWNNAQFLDTSTPEPQTLLIDNLIATEIGNTVEGSPNYQWAGIHDGEFLTLFVFGKELSPSTGVSATRDSGPLLFNDDSIELFWDGNLSRGNDFDSEDDMHIIIPLVRGAGSTATANKSGESDSTIERGPNMNSSVPFDVNDTDTIEFAACLCQGERTTWEIRINLEKAQIPVGKTFGFEIQLSQDDDGGARDAKWAWALAERKPTDNNSESDVTWRFPSTMGLMKLLAFPGR